MEQNKVRTYILYAVGEIALVMIGILLALQVNNWNEQRKENEREKTYLSLLLQDIQTDREFYELNIEFYKIVLESGTQFLSHTAGEVEIEHSNWELLVAAFHASQIWPVILRRATYDELQSTGDLSIIDNAKLRNRLGYYYGGGSNRYNSTIGINPPYRKLSRMMIPYDIIDYMWDECHETIGDIQQLLACESIISEEEAAIHLNKLINNDELIGELSFFMSAIKGGFEPLYEQYRLSEEIIVEVESSLGVID